MKKKTDLFVELASLFRNNGFSLYLVGGTVRDILLKKELTDMDVVTDATPEEMKTFLKADFTFSKMGSVRLVYEDVKFDITTLRRESGYVDYRHPDNIVFVKTPKEDYVRRDFTVNAMYMNSSFNLIDYVNGFSDLQNHIIRMVGDPEIRLKEDPLRILRAIRFALTYDFSIDEKLSQAIFHNNIYLKELSKDKIRQELKKINDVDEEKLNDIFHKYSIQYLLDMIK